jgi:general secretion pathway protein G
MLRLENQSAVGSRQSAVDDHRPAVALASSIYRRPPTADRRRSTGRRLVRGFTIAELVTVVAIIGILAAVALPVARFGLRRQKEIELHDRLRKITDAIDRYHELMTTPPPAPTAGGAPPPPVAAQMKALGSEGYPKDFDELLKGVTMSDQKTVRLIRERDLIDPMTGRKEWNVLSSSDDPDSAMSNTCSPGGSCQADHLYEVHSTSTALALDGKTHYNEW